MAISVKVKQLVEFADAAGNIHSMGQGFGATPISVTCSTGAVYDSIFSVASATATKIFDITEDLADFDFMAVLSDQSGFVELATNSAALFFDIPITANVPLIIAPDDTKYGGAVGAFDGSADTIERVYVYQSSGSTANVRIIAAT